MKKCHSAFMESRGHTDTQNNWMQPKRETVYGCLWIAFTCEPAKRLAARLQCLLLLLLWRCFAVAAFPLERKSPLSERLKKAMFVSKASGQGTLPMRPLGQPSSLLGICLTCCLLSAGQLFSCSPKTVCLSVSLAFALAPKARP